MEFSWEELVREEEGNVPNKYATLGHVDDVDVDDELSAVNVGNAMIKCELSCSVFVNTASLAASSSSSVVVVILVPSLLSAVPAVVVCVVVNGGRK